MKLVQEILQYFLRNPLAADTLDGIARWRLLDERMHRSLEETTQALMWLVSQALLTEECEGSSRRIFRLNTEKSAEIDLLLKDEER